MRRGLYFFILLSVMLTGILQGTTKQGGKGLIYVHSARVIPKGYVEFYAGTRFFGKVAQFGGKSNAYTLWDVQGLVSFNFGISSHIEFAISPIIYQDTNGGSKGSGEDNFPDDLFLSVKVGSFGALESPFLFGGLLYSRIPVASEHNIVYEPYSTGRLEIGITGLVSYYSNTLFPEEAWSIHGNLGYLNHNDVGKELTANADDPTPQNMSTELLFGVGVNYPFDTFKFSAELNTRYFLQKPPVSAYSCENVTYFTAGIYYTPYPWVTFEMGVDFKLLTEDDLSDYVNTDLPIPPPDFPNYPSLRGILGVKLAVLPTRLYSSSEKAQLKKDALSRRSTFERMMEEEKDTENAESELSRIRARREKLEEDLKRLTELLEEEKKKK